MKQIQSITIKHYFDSDPDASYLGEYSSHRNKFSFDRRFLRDQNQGEYRYFNPAVNPLTAKTQKERKELYLQAKRDYERMESLQRGNWQFIGIKAEAKITVNGIIQHISSGGLWGIESDIGDDYIEEVEKAELSDLKNQLKELGFKQGQINKIEVQKDDKIY